MHSRSCHVVKGADLRNANFILQDIVGILDMVAKVLGTMSIGTNCHDRTAKIFIQFQNCTAWLGIL